MSSLFNINVCRVCMQNDRSSDLMSDNGLLEKFEFTTRLQVESFLKSNNLPLKGLLILDNAPSHPPAENLIKLTEGGKIWAMFMPPNVTPLIQPMDQNAIRLVKLHYRNSLLSKIVTSESDVVNFFKNLTLYDASCMIGLAWNNVKQDTLSKCWNKILIDRDLEFDEEDDIPLSRILEEDEIVSIRRGVRLLSTVFPNISKEDNMPKAICSKCTAKLKVAYHFIKTAYESEKNLKQFLDKISSELKEVTQGRNKSSKNFVNEQNFTEDDILSLMDEENHEEVTTCGNVNDNNRKKYKAEIEVRNSNGKHIQNLEGEKLDNCKNENGYTFSKDVLLIDGSNEIDGTYKNNTHLMEISLQDDGEKKSYNEEVDDHELENNQTYTSINILESNDESEIRCQSPELTIEESEENIEYDMIINSQDDTIQCQSAYIDEISVEINNQKDDDDDDDDDDFHTNNLKKEIEDSNRTDEIVGDSERATENFSKRENIVYRFYCIKCNRDFSTKTNLNRHMQSHEGNKPFSCTECKKSFTQKSTLKQHMYIHTGERPYVCEVCNRGFTQCKSLIFHMRRHTGEKPFHCEYCLITFRQKDALRIHILKHHVIIEQTTNGIEIFSCIICQKKFETKVDFKTHMKIHTTTGEVDNAVELFEGDEEKHTTKYTKNLSDAMSTDSEYFNAAVVNVSASSAAEPSRAKKFQCRKCFKCFALKKSLVRHMRIHYVKSDDLSECIDCDLKFSTAEAYQEHISLCHQYACSACPLLVFKTMQELKIHMIEHELDQ